jgi:GTP-binding protein LepA
MEIISERLRREYNLKLTFTSPSVAFHVKEKSGDKIIYSVAKMPDAGEIEFIEEPWVMIDLITPAQFLGPLTALVNEHKGSIMDTATLTGDRLLVKFEAPLREIIVDFYDELKSISRGFASMSYEFLGFRRAP